MIEYHGHYILTMLLHQMWDLIEPLVASRDLYNIQVKYEN